MPFMQGEDRMGERKKLIEGRTDIASRYWRDDITALLATQKSVDLAVRLVHRLHMDPHLVLKLTG